MGWLRDTFARAPAAPAAAPAAPVVDWRKRGNEAVAAGDYAEAARCYEQGIAAVPGDASLRLNLGFALLELGRFGVAEVTLRQAIALRRPEDTFVHEAYFLLGRAQAAQEQLEPALASMEAARKSQPDFAEAIEEGARILMQLERHAECAEWLRALVALRPTVFNRVLLASALNKCDGHAEAKGLLDEVCVEEPANVEALLLRYAVHNGLKQHEAALADIDRALTMVQPTADLLANRSVPLERMGRYEEARQALEQALRLDPTHRLTCLNLATVLLSLLRVHESIAVAEAGLRAHPDDGDLHWTLGMGLMTIGDLQRGWAEAEWRSRSVAFSHKSLQLSQPRWEGQSLEGKTIFLHAEQGFGDEIQFVRFVPEVARRAKSVLVLVAGDLEPLVAASLPANARILPQHSVLPPIDYQCALMSVPAVLGTTLETLPAKVPYLHAQPEATQAWRERLAGTGLKVGIAWSGNPKHANDHNRSMTLETFRAIDAEGCRFFTVQPHMRDADRALFPQWSRAEDVGRELREFRDTAALLEALDLVITVDTSVAHLAGALARPVWVLLPYMPDWRWLLDRTDSPWYPTARLYRQPALRDWPSVLARVRADLVALAARQR